MATARGWVSDDDDCQHLDISELIATMEEAFPSVPRHSVRRVVHNHGVLNAERVADRLLRMSDIDEQVRPQMGQLRSFSLPRRQRNTVETREFTSSEETLAMRCDLFRGFLPDADPAYLREKAVALGENEALVQEWLEAAMKNRDYPTLIDYLKRKECQDTIKRYAAMDAMEFLGMYPEGQNPSGSFATRIAPSEAYKANVGLLVRMLFQDAPERTVEEVLSEVKGLLVPAVNCLEHAGFNRAEMPSYEVFETDEALDLAFIEEMTYLRLEVEIEALLHIGLEQREEAKAEARTAGTLFECPICSEDDVFVCDVLACSAGNHSFCVSCVRRQAEMASSEARSTVSCLEHQCPGVFPLPRLRGIIAPSLFSSLLKAVQQNELKQAALDDILEACQFCSFSCEIENQHADVFKCLNPMCRKDSCRKCKKAAHGPAPCVEVETDTQTQARLLLEEKLTSAMVRLCPRCKKEVLLSEGCNHMTCPCGAEFCYVCRQEIKDVYDHYQNGRCNQFEEYSAIHNRDVTQAVQEGKNEVQEKFGNVELLHDPTANVGELLPMSDEHNSYADVLQIDDDVDTRSLRGHRVFFPRHHRVFFPPRRLAGLAPPGRDEIPMFIRRPRPLSWDDSSDD